MSASQFSTILDHGPIYSETMLGRFPVEPWNTYSNICFLLLVIYWAKRTGFRHRQHPLIISILPILLVGFVGGSLFHATRSNRVWLIMDFMPILICSLVAAIHLWGRVLNSLWKGLGIVLLYFIVLRILIYTLDLGLTLRITVGYSSLAFGILLPAIIHSGKQSWTDSHLLIATGCSFVVALFFRYIDQGIGKQLLQMGTHFLWHVFGAISVYFLTEYIFRDDLRQTQKTDTI